jgi:hypothetical protein
MHLPCNPSGHFRFPQMICFVIGETGKGEE